MDKSEAAKAASALRDKSGIDKSGTANDTEVSPRGPDSRPAPRPAGRCFGPQQRPEARAIDNRGALVTLTGVIGEP